MRSVNMLRKIKLLLLGLGRRNAAVKGNLAYSVRVKHFSDAIVGQCQENLFQLL